MIIKIIIIIKVLVSPLRAVVDIKISLENESKIKGNN